MKVHFVCTGNAFRSRLAEAYLNSKKNELQATSSGIEAIKNENGAICWYAQRLFRYRGLLRFTKVSWEQTTLEMLVKADLVIFMTKGHLRLCQKKLGYRGHNYRCWDIPDFDDLGFTTDDEGLSEDIERIKVSENIFRKIQEQVDLLEQELHKNDEVKFRAKASR